MLPELRRWYLGSFTPKRYSELLQGLEATVGAPVEFRIAETPVFLPKAILDTMAQAGIDLTRRLLDWPEYLAAAEQSIPAQFHVAGKSSHPNFLTADFALVSDEAGSLVPRLVEIQAFPSVYAYQEALCLEYSRVFGLPKSLGIYLGGLDQDGYRDMLRRTVLGAYDARNVVLTEVDPTHQKTLPDFLLTARHLGISVVDITTLVPVGNKLHYKDAHGELIPIHRIYNRAIADEMMARKLELPFDLTAAWDVEWAGHPNWYFQISKFSVPWLCRKDAGGDVGAFSVVPPAVFLEEFLEGAGEARLRDAGVALPKPEQDAVYEELLLKPLFSFAGKGIQFAPSRRELLAIPVQERSHYLLQQKMRFVPAIQTPHGMTQAEIRILYLWPDGEELLPVLPLVRLGRGKMMGVDHNRNQEWVGASAAFWSEDTANARSLPDDEEEIERQVFK